MYFAAVILLVVGMLAVSYLLGQRHKSRATGEPYESGIVSTGTAQLRFSAQFYLVAMLFVIFDLEAVFIFAWAISFRELGWSGYIGALIFIGTLFVALLYAWRLGALDWGSRGRQIARRQTETRITAQEYPGRENVSYPSILDFPVIKPLNRNTQSGS